MKIDQPIFSYFVFGDVKVIVQVRRNTDPVVRVRPAWRELHLAGDAHNALHWSRDCKHVRQVRRRGKHLKELWGTCPRLKQRSSSRSLSRFVFSSNSINFLFFDYVINFSLPALLRAENQKKKEVCHYLGRQHCTLHCTEDIITVHWQHVNIFINRVSVAIDCALFSD